MISGILIIFLLAAFVGIFAWAYAPRQRERFAEAAALPLVEDCAPSQATLALYEDKP